MQIYLQHKDHGKKIAHAKGEADLDKVNGWKEVEKDEYFQTSKKADVKGAEKEPIQAPSQENVESASPKRKGRPPKNALT